MPCYNRMCCRISASPGYLLSAVLALQPAVHRQNCCRYGVTKEPSLNRQMLGLTARELTLVDSKARRHALHHLQNPSVLPRLDVFAPAAN